ncbi:MAG: GIY-YIG nuclease family protein [Alphaproteobacteria bacterium]|nr:GIY-YIG nuclease family protein [Alphaproteobacteria bacterium]
MKAGYVYMMSNQFHGTLYIGVTSDLIKRVWQHKAKIIEGFTKQYDLTKLVWYEVHETIESAIITEKKLKNLLRSKKIAIIEKMNPGWDDLYHTLTEDGSCATAAQSAG